jgi:hypothetical protein
MQLAPKVCSGGQRLVDLGIQGEDRIDTLAGAGQGLSNQPVAAAQFGCG